MQIKKDTTIKEYQDFIKDVYGPSNDKYFDALGMLINIQRFTMRGLKGIRKKDKNKTKNNLIIATSWFTSLMNQLHIDIENKMWRKFPYLCPYCECCPCNCKKNKKEERKKLKADNKKHPLTLNDFQVMFNKIYPSRKRTLEDAGIHLAEEMGELAESFLEYRGSYKKRAFKDLEDEAADFFTCMLGVFNSLNVSLAKELSLLFNNNCHACKKCPCVCKFQEIIKYKS